MDPFGRNAIVTAIVFSTLLAYRGVKKKSLSPAGALTGATVGFLLVSTGLRGFTLFFFYQVGSWATKYKKEIKQSMDATAIEGSERGPKQVLAVSALAVILSLVHAWKCGAERTVSFEFASSSSRTAEYDDGTGVSTLSSYLTLGILAHHATSLGDTLASELGSLAKPTPRLITAPWRPVPAGTNGGVTAIGIFWSFAGGALCGLFTAAMDLLSGIETDFWRLTAFGGVCGLLGSLVDSLMGATLQSSFWDPQKKRVCHSYQIHSGGQTHISGLDLLNNEQVNLASICVTVFLGSSYIGPIIFST